MAMYTIEGIMFKDIVSSKVENGYTYLRDSEGAKAIIPTSLTPCQEPTNVPYPTPESLLKLYEEGEKLSRADDEIVRIFCDLFQEKSEWYTSDELEMFGVGCLCMYKAMKGKKESTNEN